MHWTKLRHNVIKQTLIYKWLYGTNAMVRGNIVFLHFSTQTEEGLVVSLCATVLSSLSSVPAICLSTGVTTKVLSDHILLMAL